MDEQNVTSGMAAGQGQNMSGGDGTTPSQQNMDESQSDDSSGMAEDDGLGDYQFGEIAAKLNINIKIPVHNLSFDEAYFLKLLAGSISLTIDEKKKIIDSIPRLSQFQIDELVRILEEERRKFRELNRKHFAQLKKLEEKYVQDWENLEVTVKEQAKGEEDQEKADDIKRQLGLM